MTRKKYFLFTFLAVTLAVFVSVAGLLAFDVYYHHKLSTSAGLNIWGYRGPQWVARKLVSGVSSSWVKARRSAMG